MLSEHKAPEFKDEEADFSIPSFGESSFPSPGLQFSPDPVTSFCVRRKVMEAGTTYVDTYLHHDDEGNNLGVLYARGEGEFHGYDEKNEYKICKEGNKEWKAHSIYDLIAEYDEAGEKIKAEFGPFIVIYNVKFYNEYHGGRVPPITSEKLPEKLIEWLVYFAKHNHSLSHKHNPSKKRKHTKKQRHTYQIPSGIPVMTKQVIDIYLEEGDQGKNFGVLYVRGKGETHGYDEKKNYYIQKKGKQKSWCAEKVCDEMHLGNINKGKVNEDFGPFIVIYGIKSYNKNKREELPLIPSEATGLPEHLKIWFITFTDSIGGVYHFLGDCRLPPLKKRKVDQQNESAPSTSLLQMTHADQTLMDLDCATCSPGVLTLLAELPAEKAHEFFAYRDAMLAILRSAPQPEPAVNNGLAQFGLFSPENNQISIEPSISSTTASFSPESSYSTEMPRNV